jgi:hypothetical protein
MLPEVSPQPEPAQPEGAFRVLATGALSAAVMSADSGSTFVANDTGLVTRYDLATGAMLGSWQVGYRLGGMDVTPDGRYLLATELTPGNRFLSGGDYRLGIYVHRLEISTGVTKTFEAAVPVSGSAFYDVAALSDGTALLSQDGESVTTTPLYLMNVEAGTFTATGQTFPERAVLTAGSDHDTVLVAPQGASGAPLYVYTAGKGITSTHAAGAEGVTGTGTRLIAAAPGGNFAVHLAGNHLYLYDSNLRLFSDITAAHPEFTSRIGGGVIAAAFSPDGSQLYLLDVDADRVFVLATTDQKLLASVPVGFNAHTTVFDDPTSFLSNYADALQVSADGRYLGILTLEDAYPYNLHYQSVDLDQVIARTDLDQDNAIRADHGVTYYGFAGNDAFVMDGGAAFGGAGDDSYVFALYPSGAAIELAGEGYDTIYSQSLTLPDNVERLILTNSRGGAAVGNTLANELVGTPGDDYFVPHLGADVMIGNGGNDRYSGTMADFDGDTIRGFDIGDSFRLSDAYLSTFDYHVENDRLLFGTSDEYSVALPGVGLDPLVASEFTSYIRGVYVFHELTLAYANQPVNLPDFNRDGFGDVLWQNVSGEVSEWQLSGRPTANVATVTPLHAVVDASWKFVDTLDVNGDAQSDILWRHVDGTVSVWTSTGSDFTVAYTGVPFGSEWRIAGVADITADRRDDLVLQRADGVVALSASTGSGFGPATLLENAAGTQSHVVGAADFNGDRRPDLLLRDDAGALSIWSGTETSFVATYFNSSVDRSWHIQGLADFSGDGQADILWRNDSGEVSIWSASEGSFNVAYRNKGVPTDWSIAAVADFNNDGAADLLWRNDSGTIATWEAAGGGGVSFTVVYENSTPDSSWNVLNHDYLFG